MPHRVAILYPSTTLPPIPLIFNSVPNVVKSSLGACLENCTTVTLFTVFDTTFQNRHRTNCREHSFTPIQGKDTRSALELAH
jgi:hypothetical protein